MGGCRCSFRDCKVNTYKNKRMHFFRYPLKKWDFFEKWRKYAKTEYMLTLSEVRKQNFVVCARHFRTECFMNYKMDRLTLTAIPTLMRLSTTQALDFEQDVDNGVLITLEETKQKHLKAPENFECPLNLDTDEDLFDKLQKLQNERNVAAEADEEVYDEFENPSEVSFATIQSKYEEYVPTEVRNYGRVKEKPLKPSASNTIEILETIEVSSTHLKRPRSETEEPANKKRLLNSNLNNDKKPTHTVIIPFAEESSPPASGYAVGEVVHISNLVQNELIDQEDIHIIGHDLDSDGEDDNNVEFIEIHNDVDDDLQADLETNDINSTVVQLKTDNRQNDLSAWETIQSKLLEAHQEIDILKKQKLEAEKLQARISFLENENSDLKESAANNERLKKQIFNCQMENSLLKKSTKDMENLKSELQKFKKECKMLNQVSIDYESLKSDIETRNKKIQELEKIVNSHIESTVKNKDRKEQLEMELNDEREKHLQTEIKLKQQISTLEQSLELSRAQILSTKDTLSLYKTNITDLQLEKLNLSKQSMEMEQSLQMLQNRYDTLNQEQLNLKLNNDSLQQKYSNLEQKYWKLEALQNQEATVSTSLENIPKACPPLQVSQPPSATSLTKAQLFNAIKRYLSASMVSLLRMEMFGSSEREWKTDERQVAVDLLRLGENVYKYFTDEWRFRLPALRDVRNWLSQSVVMDDEDDL